LDRGKPHEFAELFETHADFVWRVLRRLGIPEADAEDVLQEVFVVVHKKLDGYVERGSVRAWLYAITRQVASHHRRTQARRQRKESVPPDPPSYDDPHREAMRRQAVEIVREFLAQLDEPRASVFYLSEVEGMSVTDVAIALGANLNTVYGRLRQSRKQFEEFVERRIGANR
jgi:RNA polymerase sigma-70 factor (ECF subfamily)